MFNGALDYLQSTIGQDLDGDLLVQSGKRFHNSVQTPLPIPLSNSVAAKHMRVVAGLTALSNAFVFHVFRPTYVMQSHGLDEALRLTADLQPNQEAYTRAVLLKVLPDLQQKIQAESISSVVGDVSEAVGRWLQNKEAFKSGLRQICDRASTTWARIQRVEEKIWPVLDFHMADGWKPLPIGSTGQFIPEPVERDMHHHQGDLPSAGHEPNRLSSSEVDGVVWPAFLAVDLDNVDGPPQFDLIQAGYVLTRSQMKAAEHEVSESPQTLAGKITRRISNATRKRKDSAVFLPNESSSDFETK